jgi:outer membrane lipoprotein carrier protein
LEQVTIQNQSKALADSPLLLMTSTTEELAEAFEIEMLKLAHEEDANLFKLTPKKEGNVFSQVHILFKNGQISELMMADTLGQQTSIQFTDVKTNQGLDKSLFQFTVPEDVDIIDSRESDDI